MHFKYNFVHKRYKSKLNEAPLVYWCWNFIFKNIRIILTNKSAGVNNTAVQSKKNDQYQHKRNIKIAKIDSIINATS